MEIISYIVVLLYMVITLGFVAFIYFVGFDQVFGNSIISNFFSILSGTFIIYTLYKPFLNYFKSFLEYILSLS